MPEVKEQINNDRKEILERLENWLELPMLILGFVWLLLLVFELTHGLSPFLTLFNDTIWVIFILDFLLKFFLAPEKLAFLRNNIITLVSLFLPALRIFRIFRVIRLLRAGSAVRGLRLFRIISSLNRGMRMLGSTMGRRGLGYVLIFTLIVLFIGAAGMYAFENEVNENGLKTYGSSLWWTAMLMTTIGSEYWPKTPEGRMLCLILSLYSTAVFGYLTASLASFFIGRDADDDETEIAGAKSIADLHKEIISLREEIRKMNSN